MVAGLAGCASSGSSGNEVGYQGSNKSGVERGLLVSPFVPDSIRVHPLTRAVRGDGKVGGGGWLIVLHVEVADAWGDPVKALGSLRIELTDETSGQSGGDQRLVWPIDLSEPGANSAAYDPVTGAYRIQLAGLEGWFDGADGSVGGRYRLRVVFKTINAQGKVVYLRDDYGLRVSAAQLEDK